MTPFHVVPAVIVAAVAACGCGDTKPPGAAATERPFRSPTAGPYRFARPPIVTVARANPAAEPRFEAWFRLNRRLPVGRVSIRARGLIGEGRVDGEVYGFGRHTAACYSTAGYLANLTTRDLHAGDHVRLRVRDTVRAVVLDVVVALQDVLPPVTGPSGLPRVDLPYARALGCGR